jgi:AmmeMemoRadiSam system protein B
MSDARPAELAGSWYPATGRACDAVLDEVERPACALPERRIGAIVPHAGWVYSGAVAFAALRELYEANRDAELIVVFGGHLAPRDVPRVMIEGGWETPYGSMPIARGLAEDLSMAINADPETPTEFYEDNAIEVLMPMIKKLWPGSEVLTVGVPPTADAETIGREAVLLAKARGFEKIAVVGSTDLTHYGPNYSYSPKGRGRRALEWVKSENDPQLIEKVAELDAAKVLWVAQRQRNACCPGAIAAAIVASRKLGAERGAVTRYVTSWEVRPSEPEPSSFVGYVGMILGS